VVSLMDFARSMSRPAPTRQQRQRRSVTEPRKRRKLQPGCRAGDHGLCGPDSPGHGTCSRCGKTVRVTASSAPLERRRCHDCRRIDPAPYGKRVEPEPPSPCELCGSPYAPGPRTRGKPQQRFCSKSCAQAWRNGARPPYTRVQDGDYGTARNARKRRRLRVRAETWDGVSDAQILERDGWRCGICRTRIGKSFKHPHPRSASIDHIIPLSMGGDDTAANKRAAHLACNCGRRNWAGWEQVALIG
jgi:HNH endonuclease